MFKKFQFGSQFLSTVGKVEGACVGSVGAASISRPEKDGVKMRTAIITRIASSLSSSKSDTNLCPSQLQLDCFPSKYPLSPLAKTQCNWDPE